MIHKIVDSLMFIDNVKPIADAPKDGTKIVAYWPDYRYGPEDIDCEPEELVAIAWWKTNPRTGKSYFSDNDEKDDYAMPDYQPTYFFILPTEEEFRDAIEELAGKGN